MCTNYHRCTGDGTYTHDIYDSTLAMAIGFKQTVDLYELNVVESVVKF
jgi:hypothetical protein